MKVRTKQRNSYAAKMPQAATWFVVAGISVSGGSAQTRPEPITAKNWGRTTSPVFGTSEAAPYDGAELFAGPNKFGSYYAGVLPNGRKVTPAGVSVQIGMNPLGCALTADGKYLLTTNDDERNAELGSLQNPVNAGGYSLSVLDTATMKVVSQANIGAFFIGLQVAGNGPYTVYASGGPTNSVRVFALDANGQISPAPTKEIVIPALLPATQGYVSHYTPALSPPSRPTQPAPNRPPAEVGKGAATNATSPAPALPNVPASEKGAAGATQNPRAQTPNLAAPVPSAFSRTTPVAISYPAGSLLSADGKMLYVACNGDNSLAVIDTTTQSVVKQIPVGYFPYGVAASRDGSRLYVANWGITEYKFAKPEYDAQGRLIRVGTTGPNTPDGFYVPKTNTKGPNPLTSSVSLVRMTGNDSNSLAPAGGIYLGKALDKLYQVGDTHPCATAVVRSRGREILYVTRANSDSLALIDAATGRKLSDFDLSPVAVRIGKHTVHGAYPNALAASPDSKRLYVAEAGINAVAVLDTTNPVKPVLLGRIPTGWYPTALAVSSDNATLYVVNAKGIGEDINPKTDKATNAFATGLQSFADSNFVFGSAQKIDLRTLALDSTTALANNFASNAQVDTSVVPIGGTASRKIKHVFFILQENKTFDSMLGSASDHFGPYASLTYNSETGATVTDIQYTGVDPNMRRLATTFATGVNYYSDSEESDAGHQFAASGTASDYTEKTLLVKTGRGLLVNKNFDPEDYPESGYLFNNAARNRVSFKVYGDMARIEGTDTGTSTPTVLNDPTSGRVGYPRLQPDGKTVTNPLVNAGDVDSPLKGLGQSYFLSLPMLAVLGDNNASGEPHLDRNYPGYNFNISDQRRAQQFIRDFDRMVASNTLPQYLHIYLPNDHTGSVQAPNRAEVGTSPLQQVADGDVALGMVVAHIMASPVYHDAAKDEGSAIFITYDDAQSSLDHIHPHRTGLVVVSPYARPGYLGKKHYSTASIVKTTELLLGLPPNNLGDLFATDLRDLFQPNANGITLPPNAFTRTVAYRPSPEGEKIWELAARLDLSGPDRDSRRLGSLSRLSARADALRADAAKRNTLRTETYEDAQAKLYAAALSLVSGPAPRDDDD